MFQPYAVGHAPTTDHGEVRWPNPTAKNIIEASVRCGGFTMKTNACAFALGLVLIAATGGAALAQPDYAAPRANGVDYLNGGIGSEQADAMRRMGADYPVQMTFAERNGAADQFVADVHLRVTDSRGRTVVDLPSQGPIFLLQVPPGAYTVEAEHQGDVKTRRFDVAAGGHDRLGFEW
jgi:hypothetical protein